jgi:hypothetical protein
MSSASNTTPENALTVIDSKTTKLDYTEQSYNKRNKRKLC